MRMNIHLIFLLSMISFLFVLSCDNSLQPFDRDSQEFSIYGKLDLRADTNFIRVKDLNTPLLPEATENFNAQVALQNITAGTEEVLDFKRVRFQDIYVFNFFTATPVAGSTEYRISVRRNGQEISASTTTTPSLTTVAVQRSNQVNPCFRRADVSIEPVAPGELIIADLGIVYDGNPYQARVLLGKQQRTDGIVEFSFIPQEILNEISERPAFPAGFITCGDLSEQNIYLRYSHLSADFDDKRLELDVPLPGVFQNLIGVYEEEELIPINN